MDGEVALIPKLPGVEKHVLEVIMKEETFHQSNKEHNEFLQEFGGPESRLRAMVTDMDIRDTTAARSAWLKKLGESSIPPSERTEAILNVVEQLHKTHPGQKLVFFETYTRFIDILVILFKSDSV